MQEHLAAYTCEHTYTSTHETTQLRAPMRAHIAQHIEKLTKECSHMRSLIGIAVMLEWNNVDKWCDAGDRDAHYTVNTYTRGKGTFGQCYWLQLNPTDLQKSQKLTLLYLACKDLVHLFLSQHLYTCLSLPEPVQHNLSLPSVYAHACDVPPAVHLQKARLLESTTSASCRTLLCCSLHFLTSSAGNSERADFPRRFWIPLVCSRTLFQNNTCPGRPAEHSFTDSAVPAKQPMALASHEHPPCTVFSGSLCIPSPQGTPVNDLRPGCSSISSPAAMQHSDSHLELCQHSLVLLRSRFSYDFLWRTHNCPDAHHLLPAGSLVPTCLARAMGNHSDSNRHPRYHCSADSTLSGRALASSNCITYYRRCCWTSTLSGVTTRYVPRRLLTLLWHLHSLSCFTVGLLVHFCCRSLGYIIFCCFRNSLWTQILCLRFLIFQCGHTSSWKPSRSQPFCCSSQLAQRHVHRRFASALASLPCSLRRSFDSSRCLCFLRMSLLAMSTWDAQPARAPFWPSYLAYFALWAKLFAAVCAQRFPASSNICWIDLRALGAALRSFAWRTSIYVTCSLPNKQQTLRLFVLSLFFLPLTHAPSFPSHFIPLGHMDASSSRRHTPRDVEAASSGC